MSDDSNNSAYDGVFYEACVTGDTRELAPLIYKKKFKVNNSMTRVPSRQPLAEAIEEQSLAVVTLLLDEGADVNHQFSSNQLTLLSRAVKFNNLKIAELLLNRGADVTAVHFQPLRMAIRSFLKGEEVIEICKLIANAVARFADDPSADPKQQKVGKYARLVEATLRDDAAQVSELLEIYKYDKFAGSLGEPNSRPTHLAFICKAYEALKVFVQADVDLRRIYFESVSVGDLDLIEMCLERQKFDPDVTNTVSKKTALHVACRNGHLEVIKLLVNKYKLQFNVCDRSDKTSFSEISTAKLLHEILMTFPNIDVRDVFWDLAHAFHNIPSEFYTVLLEHGADPILISDHSDVYHTCSQTNCSVVKHLQKLMIIDPKYANLVISRVLDKSKEEFQQMVNPDAEKYEVEISKMKSLIISQGTTTAKAKSVFDFILLGANDAARYSRNINLLEIYKENEQDFTKPFPNYGFALNRQLKRGQVRRQRLESALELLCLAFGTGLPEDFAELVFGHFSHRTLEKFSVGETDN